MPTATHTLWDLVTWDLVTKVIAIIAFILSLWNALSLYFLCITYKLVNDNKILLAQETELAAFNMLFFIDVRGPNRKWGTVKMENAQVKIPSGATIKFPCNTILKEEGLGQKNDSRNVLIAIKGSESKVVTFAFQSSEFKQWVSGEYSVSFEVRDVTGKTITSPSINFTLSDQDLAYIRKPQSTYIKQL